MSITTVAQLDSAPRTRFSAYRSSMFINTSASYTAWQLSSSAPTDAFGAVATPAAIGSGGTLWSNGTAGFPSYPQTDSIISGFSFGSTGTAYGTIFLYDLVWAASGVAMNTTATQNVTGFPALSRPDANGTGLEAFVFVRTAASSASATGITLTYTNTAGTGSRTATLRISPTTTTCTLLSTLLPLMGVAGDLGIKSIQSVALSVAQGSAGDMWIVLGRRLCQFTAAPNMTKKGYLDAFRLGMPPIGPSAALCVVSGAGQTSVNSPFDLELAHG